MALKIKSISGIEDIVVSFADSANNVPATGIVGLETSGNIEQVVQGDKLILIGKGNSQEYVGAGIINVNGNTISADMDNYYTVDEINDFLDEKYDTSAFKNVSGTFLTAHQPISADEWNSCYETVSANSATWMTETDWTDDINAASAYALDEAKTWVENQNYISGVDLSNYYTKEEVNEEIAKIGSYVVVNETTGEDNHPVVEKPTTKVIYLTKQTEGKPDNYNEWIYKEDTKVFDCIGETTLDLEDYYKKTETSAASEISAALALFVPLSASKCMIGSGNSVSDRSNYTELAQGYDNIAKEHSFAQGSANSANVKSFAQGVLNSANSTAMTQGDSNYGNIYSFTQGLRNSAYYASLAQGEANSAIFYSQAQGIRNYAHNFSSAVGSANSGYERGISLGLRSSAHYTSLAVGDENWCEFDSFTLGTKCSASNKGLAVGLKNSAYMQSFAQGDDCSARDKGFAQGDRCYAYNYGFAQGLNNTAVDYSIVAGQTNNASAWSTSIGLANTAQNYSFAQGKENLAQNYSFAQGENVIATGQHSHAEGYQTTAEGDESHAEGSCTIASGTTTHAEGSCTIAIGVDSHTEGSGTSAVGHCSHAAGEGTIANYDNETVVGQYNLINRTDNPLFVVGCGDAAYDDIVEVRSDAFVVTKGGIASAWKMKVPEGYVVGTNSTPTANQVLTYDGTNIVWANAQSTDLSNYYTKNETSAASALSAEFDKYVTDVMLTSSYSLNESVDVEDDVHFVTNGVADLTPLYNYIKNLEYKVTQLEALSATLSTVSGIVADNSGRWVLTPAS